MSPPALVIFDADGTLVDTEGISAEVLSGFIAAQGWEISPTAIGVDFRGWSLSDVQRTVEEHTGHAVPPGWLADFQTRRAEVFREGGVREIPGAGAAIAELTAAGLEVCVASNAALWKSRLTLGLTGLAELIDPDRVFSAAQVARGKPAPDLFLHAARACGRAPADCLVVEDSPTGVTAARAAGIRVLGYAGPGGGGAETLAQAGAEVITDLREVPRAAAPGHRRPPHP